MTDLEPVHILGAGAIGSALAVHLHQQGRDVILVRTSRSDVARGTSRVVVRGGPDGELSATLATISLDRLEHMSGLVIVSAKSYANAAIAARLARIEGRPPIVVMQNGLGVEAPFLAEALPEIYRCIIFATGQKEEDGSYSFRSIKPSPIGVIKGSRERLGPIVQALSAPAFRFIEDEKIQETIWQKAIINAVFNSICPLLDVDNGIFDRDERARALAASIVGECVAVAKAQGIVLEPDQILQQVVVISRGSAGQAISTLQDIRRGSPTEIASLNLAIAEYGDRAQPRVSVERTRVLGRMIELKAALRSG